MPRAAAFFDSFRGIPKSKFSMVGILTKEPYGSSGANNAAA